MRDIAAAAGMATGAAYHHFPSKDAMVMAFYEKACDEMQPLLESAMSGARGLERQLTALIRVKLEYFQPYRTVLKALLKNGADPQHPLSPFAAETRAIREADLAWFRRLLADVKVPRDLSPHLPELLWLFQMGVIYFWITDSSPRQVRTMKLLTAAVRGITWLIRLAGLPLSRPLRRPVIDVINIVKGDA